MDSTKKDVVAYGLIGIAASACVYACYIFSKVSHSLAASIVKSFF